MWEDFVCRAYENFCENGYYSSDIQQLYHNHTESSGIFLYTPPPVLRLIGFSV